MLTPALQVLRQRYTLRAQLEHGKDYEVWASSDDLGNDVLLKAWSFPGKAPDAVQRQLWDVEQRNLYRLASSPDVDSQLVVLRDADLERSISDSGGYFIMALQTSGFQTLEDVLADRGQCQWLRHV